MADKIALAMVTGATSGIGLALCRLLAGKQINLIIHGRDRDKLAALASVLSGKVVVETIIADLVIAEDQQRVARFIADRAPDLLINNAGFGIYGDAIDSTTEENIELLQVNGLAAIRFSLEAARTLIAQHRKGVILNVSSVAAFFIFPGFSTYSASKALLNQFSESFDEETRSYGVRVLAACPGMVATNFRINAGGMDQVEGKGMKSMAPDFAAEEIWRQIESKQKLRIFNWPYRLAVFLARYILPKRWIAKRLNRNIENLKKPKT